MSLTLCCQLDRLKEAGRKNAPAAPVDLAPETALGSLSSVALSSVQATPSIPRMAPTVPAIQVAQSAEQTYATQPLHNTPPALDRDEAGRVTAERPTSTGDCTLEGSF